MKETLLQYYENLLPLFARIDDLVRQKKHVLIAIDGDCASGKSTLANILCDVYDGNVIAMDDFFLRPEQRNQERLEAPGGNIDYERFIAEVLQYLRKPERIPFSYQPFNCQTMQLDEPISVAIKSLTVIEGSYSHHPLLADFYDLKVFLSIPEDIQLKRILKRNGMPMYERFTKEWIPMEKKYASAFKIKEHSDLHFDYLDF